MGTAISRQRWSAAIVPVLMGHRPAIGAVGNAVVLAFLSVVLARKSAASFIVISNFAQRPFQPVAALRNEYPRDLNQIRVALLINHN